MAKKEPAEVGKTGELDPEQLAEIGALGRQALQKFQKYPVSLPTRGQTAALTLTPLDKVAALAYDRVWFPPPMDDIPATNAVPAEVRFWGGTPLEVAYLHVLALANARVPFAQAAIALGLRGMSECDEAIKEWLGVFARSPTDKVEEAAALRAVVSAIARRWNKFATLVLPTEDLLERVYRPGDAETILATFSRVALPEPRTLTWEQVLEFRRDDQAREAYRRFVHWLEKDMSGRTVDFIAEDVAIKLAAYRTALRKHGVKTTLGVLTRMVHPSWAAAGVTSTGLLLAHGQDFWAAVAAATVLTSSLVVSVAQATFDREQVRGEHSEIAFVHQVAAAAEKTQGAEKTSSARRRRGG